MFRHPFASRLQDKLELHIFTSEQMASTSDTVVFRGPFRDRCCGTHFAVIFEDFTSETCFHDGPCFGTHLPHVCKLSWNCTISHLSNCLQRLTTWFSGDRLGAIAVESNFQIAPLKAEGLFRGHGESTSLPFFILLFKSPRGDQVDGSPRAFT